MTLRSAVLAGLVAVGRAAGPLPRSTDMPVLQEPTPQEHYAFLRDYKEVPFSDFPPATPPQITRLTNMDDATFQQLVRDGTPFVVDDCMKGVDADAISNFQCKDFADRWPTGNMRAEYTEGQYHIFLKDKQWYSKLAPTKKHKEHMAGNTKIAGPYIWHVKDEEPLKTKRSVQKHWRTPYFLQHSLTNRMEANESFEFWFSMSGGGTFTHADAYCESTISMQFRGKKRWRIQAFPEIRHHFNASSFGDEQIYENKQHVPWTPETEFTVGPGECFVFPTGYLHETYVDPADNNNEVSCFTASTFQFNHPRQVNLYRAYLSRFSMSHYGMAEPCLEGITTYATLMGVGKLKGDPDAAKARLKAEGIVKRVDSNGDGRVTVDEMHKQFCTGASAKKVINEGGFNYVWMNLLSKDQKKELRAESLQVWAEDALQYHDLNRDKAVTVDELAHGLLQWHVVNHRSRHAKKIVKGKGGGAAACKTMMQSEKDMLSKFYCKDAAACPALEELSTFGKGLSTGKCKRKLGDLKGMMQGESTDTEEHEYVDRETGKRERKKVKDVNNAEL